MWTGGGRCVNNIITMYHRQHNLITSTSKSINYRTLLCSNMSRVVSSSAKISVLYPWLSWMQVEMTRAFKSHNRVNRFLFISAITCILLSRLHKLPCKLRKSPTHHHDAPWSAINSFSHRLRYMWAVTLDDIIKSALLRFHGASFIFCSLKQDPCRSHLSDTSSTK